MNIVNDEELKVAIKDYEVFQHILYGEKFALLKTRAIHIYTTIFELPWTANVFPRCYKKQSVYCLCNQTFSFWSANMSSFDSSASMKAELSKFDKLALQNATVCLIWYIVHNIPFESHWSAYLTTDI